MSDERLRDSAHWARTIEKRLYMLEHSGGGTVGDLPLTPRVVLTTGTIQLSTTPVIVTYTQSGLPSHEGPQWSAMFNGTGRFQAPWTGLYQLDGIMRFDALNGGYPSRAGGELLRNGARLSLTPYAPGDSGAATTIPLSWTLGLDASDYLEFRMNLSGGATSGQIQGGYAATRISFTYLGAAR